MTASVGKGGRRGQHRWEKALERKAEVDKIFEGRVLEEMLGFL